MVLESDLSIEPPCYLVHPAGKVISGVRLFTSPKGVALAERVLREDFRLVEETDRSIGGSTDEYMKVGLVVERAGPGTGFAHLHLQYRHPRGSHVYIHHWQDRLIPEDFASAQTDGMMRRIYELIQPIRVTDTVLRTIASPF